MGIILLIGAVQGFTLAAVLLAIKHGNKKANRILALILFLFSLNIIIHVMAHNEKYLVIPRHSEIIQILFFLFGPLVLFYIQGMTIRNFNLQKEKLIHFIPFILICAAFLPFYFYSLGMESFGKVDPVSTLGKIISWILIIHILGYLLYSIRILRIHAKNIKSSFSSIEKISLNWLKILLYGCSLLWISALALEIHQFAPHGMNVVWLAVAVFMYLIGYMGLRQPEIFRTKDFHQEKKPEKKKYEKSTLTKEQADDYLSRLLDVMEKEKPYLDSHVTLYGLANKLGMLPHHLSQILNERLGKNFFEFIKRCLVV